MVRARSSAPGWQADRAVNIPINAAEDLCNGQHVLNPPETVSAVGGMRVLLSAVAWPTRSYLDGPRWHRGVIRVE